MILQWRSILYRRGSRYIAAFGSAVWGGTVTAGAGPTTIPGIYIPTGPGRGVFPTNAVPHRFLNVTIHPHSIGG